MSGIKCMWMRGGTSKGGFFLKDDLPGDTAVRDAFLLSIMGSPDPRQIDGMGGADPLTSKVALVGKSERDGVDVDYLFLQLFVDQAIVTDAQNCGNILSGVGPFAIERGLIAAQNGETPVRVFMENTGQIATVIIQTPNGKVNYAGDARIDGVPGTAAPVPITFEGTAGSTCGALLPTGNNEDLVQGVKITMIDNGMPCVILDAANFGVTGYESREDMDGNDALKAKLEAIRLEIGPMMNLGDVSEKSIPKMVLVAPPRDGGAISTRSFIPHRCHASIGVLGAVSVATACLLPGGPAARMANTGSGNPLKLAIEHPSGETTAVLELDAQGAVEKAGLLRTARKLMDGEVFAQ